jgi:uncharacterized protein (DUF488 family)
MLAAKSNMKVWPLAGRPSPRKGVCDSRAIYSIGHSTRPIGIFIEILNAYGIQEVVDVRRIPKSKHNPQFNQENLKESLQVAGIGYMYSSGLGGFRHATSASINKGWRNLSFRGYADYMQTNEFASALETMIKLSNRRRIALMCAESLPWRCHRSLIEDELLVRKIQTFDIFDKTTNKKHILTPWAKVTGKTITYP